MSHVRLSSLRTRWSAIGAAVAITLGAGSLLTASAAEPSGSVFIPVSPTRVLDTRIAAGLSGPLTNSVPALLDVTGNIPIVNTDQTIGSAIVVPDGATSIVANVTGVTPTTIGYVAIRPGDAPGTPSTSSINFTAPGVIVPNSVTVAIPTSGANVGHLNLFFFGVTPDATTHLLIDIVGYYTPGGEGGGTPGPEGPAGPTGPPGPAGEANTGHSISTPDGVGGPDRAGDATSIAIGTNGNPVISYHDTTAGDLAVIACTTPGCSGPQTAIPLVTADVAFTSIAIGTNGNPVVAYYDLTGGDLEVVACTNPTCTGPQSPITLDGATDAGWYPSITISTNGNPIITYHDASGGDLKVVACTNPTCTGPQSPITLDADGKAGYYTSITIGTNGNPIISYQENSMGDLKVIACSNPTCTGPQSPITLDTAGFAGQYTSMTIGTNGNPIISYREATAGDLKVIACTNTTCTGPQTSITLDTAGDVGSFMSIIIGTNGNPVISYYEFLGGELRVLACGNPTCQNYAGRSR